LPVVTELVIGNIVRRVMHIVREEMEEDVEDELAAKSLDTVDAMPKAGGLSKAFKLGLAGRALSLHNLLDQGLAETAVTSTTVAGRMFQRQEQIPQWQSDMGSEVERRSVRQTTAWDRKQEVIDGVNELIEELKDIDNSIANQAVEHIHANEIILTFGYSRTVLQFLRRAREKRDFEVNWECHVMMDWWACACILLYSQYMCVCIGTLILWTQKCDAVWV
jgi:translation initiation factor eIF-2B subunit beta